MSVLKRFYKKAAKFQFTASYTELIIETDGFKPSNIVITAMRRSRKYTSEPIKPFEVKHRSSYSHLWERPINEEIIITLYKMKKEEEYEGKDWTFQLEDTGDNGTRRRLLAYRNINMSQYASLIPTQNNVKINFKISSKKIKSATLFLTLSAVFIKEGEATSQSDSTFTEADKYENFFNAVKEGNLEDFETFYEREFREKCGSNGWRAIHYAAKEGHIDIINKLIDRNCDIEAVENIFGRRAIHYAAKEGHIDIINKLIDCNCDIEAADNINGWRAIHHAAARGHINIIDKLIGCNCDVNSLTKEDQSVLDIAQKYSDEEFVDLLEKSLGDAQQQNTSNRLQLPNRQLKQFSIQDTNVPAEIICRICQNNKLDCVFDCGHAFCMGCGQTFSFCPICGVATTNPKKLLF